MVADAEHDSAAKIARAGERGKQVVCDRIQQLRVFRWRKFHCHQIKSIVNILHVRARWRQNSGRPRQQETSGLLRHRTRQVERQIVSLF